MEEEIKKLNEIQNDLSSVVRLLLIAHFNTIANKVEDARSELVEVMLSIAMKTNNTKEKKE